MNHKTEVLAQLLNEKADAVKIEKIMYWMFNMSPEQTKRMIEQSSEKSDCLPYKGTRYTSCAKVGRKHQEAFAGPAYIESYTHSAFQDWRLKLENYNRENKCLTFKF